MTTTLASDLMLAARSLDTTHARLLVFGPIARGNPYQELIYSELRTAGIAPVPCLPWEQRSALLAAAAGGITTGFHLHWTTAVTADADDEADAGQLVDRFVDELDRWQQAGVLFVWTIHNRLPHRTRFPEIERTLRKALAQRANLVHVMTAEAANVAEELYAVPRDRTVVVPHPSYAGAYPTYFRRDDCRLRLGIDAHDLVVAAVGAIESYKNLPMLHDAVRLVRARTGRRVWIIVAGHYDPSLDPSLDQMLSDLRHDPYAVVEPRRLSDREMSEYVTAADIVASCYDTPFVSGSAMLAATIGRPTLAVDSPQSRDMLGDAAHYAELADADSIASVLAELGPVELGDATEAARALALRLSPESISQEMTRAIDDVLSADSTGSG